MSSLVVAVLRFGLGLFGVGGSSCLAASFNENVPLQENSSAHLSRIMQGAADLTLSASLREKLLSQ